MSEFSDEEIYREIGVIVSQYDILKCDLCAKAVLKWLAENGIAGKLLKLKTKYREEFILSTRLERWVVQMILLQRMELTTELKYAG